MRRPQQGDGGGAAEAGLHELDDEPQCRRIGLGRQRKCIARLKRHAGLRKQLPREIEVRQRTLKHDRGACRGGRGLQRTGHLQQLLLAVAPDEVNMLAVAWCYEQRRCDGRVEPLLVNARQVVRQSLVETGGQHGVGGDDVDPLQPRNPRQQVEVGWPQSVGFGRLVGKGRHDGKDWTSRPAGDQPLPQAVLVVTTGVRAPLLERAERGGEKPGLLQQPPRAAVEIRARLEVGAHEALEAVDGLTAPPQLVIELHD